MFFNDRRKAKFKNPSVEAVARAGGIKAMPAPSKDPWKSNEGHYERQDVHYAAREAGWKETSRYDTEDRGDRYKEGARVVEAKQQAEAKAEAEAARKPGLPGQLPKKGK
jgi:hypothetical protein